MGTATDSLPSQQKHMRWKNHIHQWQASGQTQQAYCLEHQLNTHTFGYWKRKLLNQDQPDQDLPQRAFIPVRTQTPTQEPNSGITLSLPNGCKLSGINEHNVALVKQLAEWLG